MNRDLLRSLAAGRRNPSEPVPVPAKRVSWHCEYCERDLMSERVFMNHTCKERDRAIELQTAIGQSAYALYVEWMKQSKRTPPPIETFASSRFYSTFIKFATWVKKVHLPSPSNYIRLMIKNKIQPPLWCRDNIYLLYLQSYDEAVNPTDQFLSSLDFALGLAQELKCKNEEVFDKLGTKGVLAATQNRKLSLWFLAASRVFRKWYQALPEAEREELSDALKLGSFILSIKDPAKTPFFREFTKGTEENGL